MHVRLTSEWTDGSGTPHQPGETVEVDQATLAQLEAQGVVEVALVGTPKPNGGSEYPGLT